MGDVHNLQEELQEECIDADGFMFDDDEDDSDNEMLDDNTSIASIQRPGLRYGLYSELVNVCNFCVYVCLCIFVSCVCVGCR